MRKKRLMLNTISSFAFQIAAIVYGFVLPRLILRAYGSEVNGLVASIEEFLAVISFLDLGVGAVVRSSMYKPLAERDSAAVSRIVSSAEKFFRNVIYILLVYIFILMIIYPYIADRNFGWLYTALLIASMSISSFSQYYFGVVDRLLLTADQRSYILYTVQTAVYAANTIVCALLIKFGASIHVVKLISSLIFLLRPVVLRIYVNRHYQLDRHIEYIGEPIKQKWNGFAQHLVSVILNETDTIVLTLFSTLTNVSVYSVYNLVVYGIRKLMNTLTTGIQALIGELWATQERDELNRVFGWTEWVLHTWTTFMYGCTACLIVPFVSVYTAGVTDAEYFQPLFGLLITLAQASICLRLPYNIAILAGGHYKQTQSSYIAAALMNIIISVAAVKSFGLVGVAVGTLAAMVFQTVWMAWYISKNLMEWPFINFLKQTLIDAVIFAAAYCASASFEMRSVSYLSWAVLALKVAAVWLAVTLAVNLLFKPEYVKKLIAKIIPSRVREH